MPIPEFDPAPRRNAATLIEMALAEDLGDRGDLTAIATIPVEARGSAIFRTRKAGVLAGMPVLEMLVERFELNPGFEAMLADGTLLAPGAEIARVEGPMRSLLAMERTALNFLQRLSGIATLTARFVAAVAGTNARILDTRKTTPGWRALEKYAVRAGGGHNHRIGLYDGVLIKDNHLDWLATGPDPIGTALRSARAHTSPETIVEIEVDTLDQFDRALECRPDIILVDNFLLDALSEAVRRRNGRAPGVRLEASGGIDLGTVAAIASTGVDRISVGALTHSAPALDIGLDFDRSAKP
jgi:nicotinate-nucleotide pyrophosphorylase (carboxylating)